MYSMNDLSQKKLLHHYHSAFFKLFHIPLDWILPDNKTFTVCGQEHCNSLCIKIMGCIEGNKMCNRQTNARMAEARNTRQAVLGSCHAGFYDLVLPIYDHEDYLGALCVGQFRLSKVSDGEIKNIARQLNFMDISPEELKEYHKNTRVFTREELEGLKELLQLIADFICATYGRSKFLASIANSSQVENAEAYIKRHYTRELSITKLARIIGMSPSYLIHQFTRQNGISPMQYLTLYRILQAVDILKNSKLSIAETAFAVGFKNVCNFNRSFRKITGVSPSECRKNPNSVKLDEKMLFKNKIQKKGEKNAAPDPDTQKTL
ncbi:MAG: helix-turn-helix domain-containing protein [Lentisphaerae bacterium]|nr:helix-turn-helix domain-containing protein [Lentisphaerota bacterium]